MLAITDFALYLFARHGSIFFVNLDWRAPRPLFTPGAGRYISIVVIAGFAASTMALLVKLLTRSRWVDVVSNVAFLLAGLAGLFVVFSGRACFEFPAERWPYAVFFLGVLLTAAGSAWYHLSPDNESLFWDRLPMTIAFMGLVSSQVVERIGVRPGLFLLGPMLLVGMASVVYWIVSERTGAGNVLPYALLQGYAVVVLLMMAALHPSRYTRANDLYFIFGWYVLAKLLEHFDAQVLAYSHAVSGHSLKHVAAAAAGFVACRMLVQRTLAAQEREA